jgi:hypothetical protein
MIRKITLGVKAAVVMPSPVTNPLQVSIEH